MGMQLHLIMTDKLTYPPRVVDESDASGSSVDAYAYACASTLDQHEPTLLLLLSSCQ